MLFNSLEFALFLPIVFAIYWLLKGYLAWQNLFVVVSSYVFYGYWDYRFLALIALTSFLSWASGILIETASDAKTAKRYLVANIVLNLLILCLFKYFNFFVDSFCALFGLTNNISLKIILPVGISFYTFQALSYSIDVYRKKIAATRDAIAFFAYVSFFPQLVAGPIERATNLLPQFERRRSFDYTEAVDGMRRILWGLFKKVVVADNCAAYVDGIWNNFPNERPSSLALAAILFAFQIYGDFSGYSDIAIGTARLFGIRLKDNFLTPYFSRNVAEFWKRWHISLNTWFVDYVYIPLGGSRPNIPNGIKNQVAYTKYITIRNTFIIFLLSGLWHGANWTYLSWGLFHSALFVPLIIFGRTKTYQGSASWRQMPQILLTFFLVSIAWIIFRAPSITTAWSFLCKMVDIETLRFTYRFFGSDGVRNCSLAIIVMLFVEWFNRNAKHGFDLENLPKIIRLLAYFVTACAIALFAGGNQVFLYFQF